MKKNVSFFGDLFRAVNFSGILITDENGIIIYVDDSFEKEYGHSQEMLLNKSVFDLEKEGVFRPSSAAIVLRSGKEVNLIQTIDGKDKVVVSAFPLYGEDKKISGVITFTRDIEHHIRLKDMYEEMTLKIRRYEKEMDDLQYENTIINQYGTRNRTLQNTLKGLQHAAKYPINILLLGETGVGKTMIAKQIHKLSEYRDGSFVEINCSALPETLIESELFGYEKGAFTGADEKGRKGLFELANKGTLFLDEVSEMPLMSQAKLLKVLQDKEFRRIGGSRNIQVDCRIIAATNKNLEDEVKRGNFRQDLYYRLNAATFSLPPLRERREDIIPLCNSILDKVKTRFGFEKAFDRTVINVLMKYDWPGNIRELENVVFRMAVTSEDRIITKACLPEEIRRSCVDDAYSVRKVSDLHLALEQVEGEIIREAYAEYGSSVKVAAALNISQATAARKINKYVREQ